MSRPRFLADHDLNEHIIDGVLRRGPSLEFVRVRDVGFHDKPDPEILEYAAEHGYLVVSHDVNTMPEHAYDHIGRGMLFAGLFMVHQTHSIRTIIEDLILIGSVSEMEEWRNQVIFLPL